MEEHVEDVDIVEASSTVPATAATLNRQLGHAKSQICYSFAQAFTTTTYLS